MKHLRLYLILLIAILLCQSQLWPANVKDYLSIEDAVRATERHGTLYFPIGIYHQNTPIILSSPISIVGEGYQSVIITNGNDLFIFNPAKKPGFENLTINNNPDSSVFITDRLTTLK